MTTKDLRRKSDRLLALKRTISKNCGDSFCEAVSQFLQCLPNNVRVLARVKVDFLQRIFSAGKDHWDIESMSKAGFVVDSTARSSLPLCEVCD